MPVTFKVNDVEAERLDLLNLAAKTAMEFLNKTTPREKGVARVEEFIDSSFAPMELSPASSGKEDVTLQSCARGFIGAVVHAYTEHRHLSIRPEDVWICILGQLALYTQAHAEETRHKFVAHEGKKGLVVVRNGNRLTVDWPDIIAEFGADMERQGDGRVIDS